MKTRNVGLLAGIVGLILFGGVEVSAQGWLDKTLKKVDKALNEVDKALNTKEQQSSDNISTPNRRMEVKVTKAELIENGKKFLLEFLLTNHGEDITGYRFGGRLYGSTAFDNLGTEASFIDVSLGSSFPSETPVKVTVIIHDVSSQATAFSRIQIRASCHGDNCADCEGDYVFKNVPIERE